MSSLDDVYIEKRLSSVANTQESIQSLSLWALHHKTQHEKIVDIWLAVLKSAELDLRLHLFYLCNEMVQTCKKKQADSFKDSFRRVLAEAAILVRDPKVRCQIERIFQIWIERSIYEAEYVEHLLSILYNQTPKSVAEAKLLAEFKPGKLLDTIKSCAKACQEVELKKKSLELLPFDISQLEAIQQKLREGNMHEEKYSNSFEEMNECLKDCISSLESELSERKLLSELLELSETYYNDQYLDASVVVQAYKNFGNRITNLKLKLLDYRKLIPDPRPKSPTHSSSLSSSSSVKSNVPVVESSYVKPICDNSQTSSQTDDKNDDGFSSIIPKLDRGYMTFLPKRIPSLGSQMASDLVGSELIASVAASNGDSTPVQDEEPDASLPFDNPMEFLSQLISRSAKQSSSPGQAASSDVAGEKKDESNTWSDWQTLNSNGPSSSQVIFQPSVESSDFSNVSKPISHQMESADPSSTNNDLDSSADRNCLYVNVQNDGATFPYLDDQFEGNYLTNVELRLPGSGSQLSEPDNALSHSEGFPQINSTSMFQMQSFNDSMSSPSHDRISCEDDRFVCLNAEEPYFGNSFVMSNEYIPLSENAYHSFTVNQPDPSNNWSFMPQSLNSTIQDPSVQYEAANRLHNRKPYSSQMTFHKQSGHGYQLPHNTYRLRKDKPFEGRHPMWNLKDSRGNIQTWYPNPSPASQFLCDTSAIRRSFDHPQM